MRLEQDVVDAVARVVGTPIDIVPLMGGAWSRAYRARTATRVVVVRVAAQKDDFEKDRAAAAFASPNLPVPDVLAIEPCGAGFLAVSAYCPGEPLEFTTANEWPALIEPVAGMLGALASATPLGAGWGGFDRHGVAHHSSWREHLLSIADEPADARGAGRLDALRAYGQAQADFERRLAQLEALTVDDVPRAVIHGDLLNRNAHVAGGSVTGVFDWGCAAYGDPLYDVAWLRFWSPWHPAIPIDDIERALGTSIDIARVDACLLHIGLDHLVYNAKIGDASALADVSRRLSELLPA